MDESRLKVMQGRAARGVPLAEASDQPLVTEGIRITARGRYAKPGKDAHTVRARSVGRKSKVQKTKDARFDDEGDEIETPHEFSLIDQYLATEIGSQAAAKAMAEWRRRLGR